MEPTPPPIPGQLDLAGDDEQCARIFPSGARCQRVTDHPGECNPVPWRHPGDLDTQTAAALAELDRLRELAAERMASTVHGVAGAATAWRTAEARLTEAVAVARAAGATWQQIGDACGITRQAAHTRWAGPRD